MGKRDEYLDCGCVSPGSLNEPGRHFCGRYNAPTSVLERVLAKHQLAEILPGGVLCTCGAELAALNPPLDDGAVKGEPLALAGHQLQEIEASMKRGERWDALRVDIYAEISYYLGIDDTDDAACDAKNAATNAVLRLFDHEMADAEDLAAKVEAAWEWIARVDPYPERNGDHLADLRRVLSGRPGRCDRCHRPLPHNEAEARACERLR